MTSSLGVEVTPGRFRSLVTSARALVERRDADLLDSLASVGDQLGALLGDRVGTRVLHDEARPPVDDRELAELLARAAEVSRRVTDALRRSGAQRSFLADDEGSTPDPDRASRKTRTLQAAVHLAEDLHRFETRGDGEVAWVDGTRRNVRLRLSPIDVGPVLAGHALGRGHVGADQRHHPAADRRAGRARGLPHRGAQRGQPVRLPLARAALRRPPPARPSRRRGGGGAARGAVPAAGGGRRAHPGPLHQPAGHRGGGGGAGARAPLHRCSCRAISPRAGCSRSSPRTRPPACSPPWASGRASTSPAAPCRSSRSTSSPSRAPTTRCSRPAGTGPAGGAFSLVDLPRAATLLAQGSGRLIRNADDRGVVAVLDPRLATASYRGVLLATLPPMRRSVDIHEVESFLRRALEERACRRSERRRWARGRYSSKSKTSVPSLVRVPSVATRNDPAAGTCRSCAWLRRVGALVPAHVAVEQPGLGEDPQMARDALPRDVEAAGDVVGAQGPAVVVQRGEDAPSDLVRQCLERPGRGCPRSATSCEASEDRSARR